MSEVPSCPALAPLSEAAVDLLAAGLDDWWDNLTVGQRMHVHLVTEPDEDGPDPALTPAARA